MLGTPKQPFTLKPRSKQNGRPRSINKEKFDNNWDKIFGDQKDDVRKRKENDDDGR
jgi:hypothetical protein